MHVGENRHAELCANIGEDGERLVEAEPARARRARCGSPCRRSSCRRSRCRACGSSAPSAPSPCRRHGRGFRARKVRRSGRASSELPKRTPCVSTTGLAVAAEVGHEARITSFGERSETKMEARRMDASSSVPLSAEAEAAAQALALHVRRARKPRRAHRRRHVDRMRHPRFPLSGQPLARQSADALRSIRRERGGEARSLAAQIRARRSP